MLTKEQKLLIITQIKQLAKEAIKETVDKDVWEDFDFEGPVGLDIAEDDTEDFRELLSEYCDHLQIALLNTIKTWNGEKVLPQ